MYTLITSYDQMSRVNYLWLKDGRPLNDGRAFPTLAKARKWFERHEALSYVGADRRQTFMQSRSGWDRRHRQVSEERRRRPHGRRWTDQIAKFEDVAINW